MRYHEILREMSYSQAKAIWLKHGLDPEATDLKTARAALMKKLHPDAGGDLEDAKLVNAAYDVLKKGPARDDAPLHGYQPRGRQRNPWHSEERERDREREEAESATPWANAGYSGGMRDSGRINRHDYTDVNYIKKRMWELSGKSTEEWTIWGFDGSYTRGVTTVYGSPKIFAQMAEAMITWQTKGANSYPCRAVLVQKRERYRSKQYMDDDGDSEKIMKIIWADGVFYDKQPIPISYETFNDNPGNDSSFYNRLRRLLDEMKDHGRQHEQPSMGMHGSTGAEADSFETGSYVMHPKYGVGRVINPAAKKGMVRVIFKVRNKDDDTTSTRTGNVKASSLSKASQQQRWQFEHGS